jgi:integrase
MLAPGIVGRPGRKMHAFMRRDTGEKTRYPGVFRINDKTYRVTAKFCDPRNGRLRQVERIIEGVTAQEAARKRADVLTELKEGTGAPQPEKRRLRDCAESWLELKAPGLDPRTAEIYAYRLALILGETGAPGSLGDYFIDALQPEDIQRWVNAKLKEEYAPESIKGSLRVLRTMARKSRLANLVMFIDEIVDVPESVEKEENTLSEDELSAFLAAMQTEFPQHYALTVVLASTGLRFCHASALRWEDIDEAKGVIVVRRKNIYGRIGAVSRKKRAPKNIPLHPKVLDVLKWHRRELVANQHPGLSDGYMFPSRTGTLRQPSSLYKAWTRCLEAAGIQRRFTVHGMRHAFNDITRRAKVDPLVIRSITGHVTEEMRADYSTVDLAERHQALATVLRLVPGVANDEATDAGMDRGMDPDPKAETAG